MFIFSFIFPLLVFTRCFNRRLPMPIILLLHRSYPPHLCSCTPTPTTSTLQPFPPLFLNFTQYQVPHAVYVAFVDCPHRQSLNPSRMITEESVTKKIIDIFYLRNIRYRMGRSWLFWTWNEIVWDGRFGRDVVGIDYAWRFFLGGKD